MKVEVKEAFLKQIRIENENESTDHNFCVGSVRKIFVEKELQQES